ncbi:DNA-binding protein [Nitrosospira sp. Nsp14]|nr:DNA-binding protein [Nitrosospira sp. Nsp14]
MNKKELVEAMAAKTGSIGAAADHAVNALLEIISDRLKKKIRLRYPALERSKYGIVPHVLAVIPRLVRN